MGTEVKTPKKKQLEVSSEYRNMKNKRFPFVATPRTPWKGEEKQRLKYSGGTLAPSQDDGGVDIKKYCMHMKWVCIQNREYTPEPQKEWAAFQLPGLVEG